MLQLIKGFKDILPGEADRWRRIETLAAGTFGAFGFFEIRPPVMERTELFKRSIGEDTDIVEKEMYTFEDRGGDLVTLRPEATASVVRAYIQHKLYADTPVAKLYTIGPMFRRERPQKGRYRQFHQINAEAFGVAAPYMDAQLIFMLMTLFSALGLKDTRVHINSLGCAQCRPAFKQRLLSFLEGRKADLCEDCTRRIDRNPLRVLDCKVDRCRRVSAEAPQITDFLCPGCAAHFDEVTGLLTDLAVGFDIDKRLVRGLDYYTRTTFEVQTDRLGAQSAIAGGGRYDELVKLLGGPDQPAVGFAVGLERLVELVAMEETVSDAAHPRLFIAALGEAARRRAFGWMCALNRRGFEVEMSLEERGLKSQMKTADKWNASHVLIAGDAEMETGRLILRDMKTKAQQEIPLGDVPGALITMMGNRQEN